MLGVGGGPFHPDSPNPWKDNSKVRSAAQIHDERLSMIDFLSCPFHFL
jgi:hypothetical protein